VDSNSLLSEFMVTDLNGDNLSVVDTLLVSSSAIGTAHYTRKSV